MGTKAEDLGITADALVEKVLPLVRKKSKLTPSSAEKAKIACAVGRKCNDRTLRNPPRKDHGGIDLISDVLPFGRLWYGEPHAVRMQSITRSFTAAHMMLCFAFTMNRAM